MERSRSIFNPLRYVEANHPVFTPSVHEKKRDKKLSNTAYAVTDIDVINIARFFRSNRVSDEIYIEAKLPIIGQKKTGAF